MQGLSEHEANLPQRVLRHQGYMIKRSLNAKKGAWQRRWIALQGRTIYWFHGADKLKGQLELTPGSKVVAYEGQDVAEAARGAALDAHPYTLAVQTPELLKVGVGALYLQAETDAQKGDWSRAIQEAIPGYHDRVSEAIRVSIAEKRPAVLQLAEVQGWLRKRSMHRKAFGDANKWQRRWFGEGCRTQPWPPLLSSQPRPPSKVGPHSSQFRPPLAPLLAAARPATPVVKPS